MKGKDRDNSIMLATATRPSTVVTYVEFTEMSEPRGRGAMPTRADPGSSYQ